ncbi:MAG: DUF5724 domain-containing protein [Leptolyngbyaceae bacterium]|nr:DUF5724 domain-containing protein [Leptolyngbyaceae bacterium]
MLKREIAQARLKEYRLEDWGDRRQGAIATLPDHLGAIAKTLLSTELQDYQQRDRALNQLLPLSSEERVAVLAVLFPKISDYVNLAYELILTLPYQEGYARRAFRSRHRQHYRTMQKSWLNYLLGVTMGYEQPLDWYAAWAPYLGYSADTLGILFAAAINQRDEVGENVFNILCDSARGEHDIGGMGRHVTRGLLVADREEGWQLVENLLVAAQRQEGLRQVILETIDEAHSQAFRRLVRLILQQDLTRFSAVIRAADVWFGLQWNVEQRRWVEDSLTQVCSLLDHPEQRQQVLAGDDPHGIYLALWTLAFEDTDAAIASATTLLQDDRVEHRYVAAYLLRQLGISEARMAIVQCLVDGDRRVAAQAFWSLPQSQYFAFNESDESGELEGDRPPHDSDGLFEALEHFLKQFSDPQTTLQPLVWPWMTETLDRTAIGHMLVRQLGDRPVERLLPHLAIMGEWGKLQVAEKLVVRQPWDDVTRDTILGLVRDRTSYVREGVLKLLRQQNYIPDIAEAQTLEKLLTRKAADLRRGVLSLLLKQGDEAAVASTLRLMNSGKIPQRLAGLELLDCLHQAERVDGGAIAQQYMEQRPKRTAAEQEFIDRLLLKEQALPTLDNALGLLQPGDRSPAIPLPMPEHPIPLVNGAARQLLKALDDWIDQHRTTPVMVAERWGDDTKQEELLGNVRWLMEPDPKRSPSENLENLPLADRLEPWLDEQLQTLEDTDGSELLRLNVAFAPSYRYHFFYHWHLTYSVPEWVDGLRKQWFIATEHLQYEHLVGEFLPWLLWLRPPAHPVEVLLNASQFTLAHIGTVVAAANPVADGYDWRSSELLGWVEWTRSHCQQHPSEWTPAQIAQLWQLLRWIDEPDPATLPHWQEVKESKGYGDRYEQTQSGGFTLRQRPELPELLAAFELGAATEADVYDQLLGSRTMGDRFTELTQLTRRKPHPLLQQYPYLGKMVNRCRDRILEIELSRGELPTVATAPARSLQSIQGITPLLKLLHTMGHENFTRGWTADGESKSAVFSHLLRISFPASTDTPESFAQEINSVDFSQQRLVEVAMYAPQWTHYVEQALGWSEFSEAVWWFHAHTRDTAWTVDSEIRELWAAQISERTPLSSQDLLDGAVDVAWFQRVHQALTIQQWAMLNEAAKYTSGGGGHKRAVLFAEAMLAQTSREELIDRIQKKRHQDAVRALGLLPLSPDQESRQGDLLERYQMIQEFLRTSRKFGSQRKVSEALACRIGMENLARTAGYPDPQRLEWAMEGVAIADLAAGPIAITVDDTTVSLSLTETGEPRMTTTKNGKSLKSIPAKLKKIPEIKQLQTRKQDITRQASRMRQALEQAMCRGDEFTGAELQQLLAHPVLRPLLQTLIFIDIDSATYGYPSDSGLCDHEGNAIALPASSRLRLAHPVDLATSQTWHQWQAHYFNQGTVQPFKQVFRELYVLTPAETQGGGNGSSRYAGHQVNPRQALALLGQRGWVAHPEEGVRRTFHDENVLVWVDFEEGWFSPTEVEGLTLDQVCFGDRRTYKPLSLESVPPKVFSEIMRDLDLVVSVAHQGGVDPEASASTVAMRAALLRETCRLLNIDNIHLQEPHALIAGTLGNYTLHLGSAIVHRQPGGSLCIVPVHSQHRGRLFLPFADDDPKTAEVISKALLLAKDDKIQDPTILEQLL